MKKNQDGRPHRVRYPVPALEWLADVSGRSPRLAATGNRRLLVENHTGVMSYGEERIVLQTRIGSMTVYGSVLELCEVRPGSLIVRGCIDRIDMPCAGGRE